MKYIQRNKKWFWFENEFLDFHTLEQNRNSRNQEISFFKCFTELYQYLNFNFY